MSLLIRSSHRVTSKEEVCRGSEDSEKLRCFSALPPTLTNCVFCCSWVFFSTVFLHLYTSSGIHLTLGPPFAKAIVSLQLLPIGVSTCEKPGANSWLHGVVVDWKLCYLNWKVHGKTMLPPMEGPWEDSSGHHTCWRTTSKGNVPSAYHLYLGNPWPIYLSPWMTNYYFSPQLHSYPSDKVNFLSQGLQVIICHIW